MSLLLLLLGSQGQHQALGHVLSLGVKGGGLLTPCHSLAQPHGAGCLGAGVESPASLSGGCEDLSGLLTWVVGHMQMARGPWRSTPALTPLPMCGSLGLPGPGMMTHFVAVREMARNETQVTCVLFPGQGWPPHWGCQIPGGWWPGCSCRAGLWCWLARPLRLAHSPSHPSCRLWGPDLFQLSLPGGPALSPHSLPSLPALHKPAALCLGSEESQGAMAHLLGCPGLAASLGH